MGKRRLVQDNDDFQIGLLAFSHVAQGTHDQEEYQDRGDPAQSPDEQVTENGDAGSLGDGKSQDDADDQTTDDPFDKAYAVPLFDYVFNCFHTSLTFFLFCLYAHDR